MNENQITKQQLRRYVTNIRIAKQNPLAVRTENLIFAFGFKRMHGEEIMMRQLLTNKTEEQLQILSPYEFQKNIEEWCISENVDYYYDYDKDLHFFK